MSFNSALAKTVAIAISTVAIALALAASASAYTPSPVWNLTQRSLPSVMTPGSTSGFYQLELENVGAGPSSGPVTVTNTLPPGVTAIAAGDGFLWSCPGAAGATVVTCGLQTANLFPNPRVEPHSAVGGLTPLGGLTINVSVDPGAGGSGENVATVTGGGAGEDTSTATTRFSADPAGFGIESMAGWAVNPDGSAAKQAGAHPDLTTNIVFNSDDDPISGPGPIGNAKDVRVDLPPGVVGDPTATPTCSAALLAGAEAGALCPPESQVGKADASYSLGFPFLLTVKGLGVYNIVPPAGSPGRLAFNLAGTVVNIDPEVRTGGDYGITARISNVNQTLAVMSTKLTLWGVPADPYHTGQRNFPGTFGEGGAPSAAPRLPFLTAPTECSGQPLRTRMTATSWQEPSVTHEASFETNFDGSPLIAEGCDVLPFDPGLSVDSESPPKRGTPAGLGIDLALPQSDNPDGLATASLKKAVVTLPEGMSVNPSSAQGLEACTPAQIEIKGPEPSNCPAGSKIGSVEAETPLLEKSLEGGIYLASQRDNPFGSTLAIYLVVEGAGVVVKLPGKVETDPSTGRVTSTFDDNPQLPFSKLSVHLKTGPRAPLTLPTACGPATTTAVLTPWSGTPPVTVKSTFDVSGDGHGGPCAPLGFNPKLSAGTTNPVAGSFSPFALQLSRSDEESQFASISSLNLPQGLVASLRGVRYCPDSALAAVPATEGTGAAQLANPSCPATSQIGTVSVGAGAGSNPFYVHTGKAYLAGPYKGAPLSLAVVTPALAGPFDLGNVVVRTALQVNPSTAQITAVSDPLPTILQGIPLDLRDIRVSVNRPAFTLNPTNCDPMAVEGTIASTSSQSARVSDRFQVANCERLPFKPALKLKVSGATKRGAYPKLRAELRAKPGEANIGRVSVALPHSEFLAQEHIRTICTRVQYAADACPAGSIYGHARAITPLLDQPLEGPVYLRSSSNPLPDLVVALKGQIEIDLAGRIDSSNGGIRNSFELVPDAPVSKFVLEMKGGKKGLLVNSRDLCNGTSRATVRMDGQNGKAHDARPVLANDCGKGHQRAKK